MSNYRLICADVLEGLAKLKNESVHCVVTSPPYWGLRDYKTDGQIGLERTHHEYVARLVAVFTEVRRVLRGDGTLWLNLGDCYATGGGNVGRCPGGGEQGDRFLRQGMINTQPNRMPLLGLKPKDLVGIPWRVAFALQDAGWYLRSDIIWAKPNPMPESVSDRPTKSHEYIFLLAKNERYFYDCDAVREPQQTGWNGSTFNTDRNRSLFNNLGKGLRKAVELDGAHGTLAHDGNGMRMPDKWNNQLGRNKRSVWTIATQAFPEAHFATFPEALIEPCILAGCPQGGKVLDPFSGSGTTGVVALRHQRNYIGIELNPAYVAMSERRLAKPDQVVMPLSSTPDAEATCA